MDINKSFLMKESDRAPRWHVIDASGEVVGRLATRIADTLRGKNLPHYTAHIDTGDYVVVINADQVKFTGDKMTDKTYVRHSGWMGGQKRTTPREVKKRHPEFIIKNAVKGMLPKNRLARKQLAKLRIYAGGTHPHTAQVSQGSV